MIYLLMTVQEFSYQNFQLDAFIYVNDPSRVLFLFSCMLTIGMLPARFTCSLTADDILCVFATLTRAPYFFFFCRYIISLMKDNYFLSVSIQVVFERQVHLLSWYTTWFAVIYCGFAWSFSSSCVASHKHCTFCSFERLVKMNLPLWLKHSFICFALHSNKSQTHMKI